MAIPDPNCQYVKDLIQAKIDRDPWAAQMAWHMGDLDGMLEAVTDFLADAFRPVAREKTDRVLAALAAGTRPADYSSEENP
jgi:hypothetical protein